MSTQAPAALAPEHSVTVNSFAFYFTFQHGDALRTYGFNVRNRSAVLAALNTADFSSLPELLAAGPTGELAREYGFHAWATRPSVEVDAIGFVTKDVELAKATPLLERWRTWFGSQGGSATRAVLLDNDVAANGDDFTIYRHIEAKLLG